MPWLLACLADMSVFTAWPEARTRIVCIAYFLVLMKNPGATTAVSGLGILVIILVLPRCCPRHVRWTERGHMKGAMAERTCASPLTGEDCTIKFHV